MGVAIYPQTCYNGRMIELLQKDAGFWKWVLFTDSCWIWMGHRDKRLGYGKYSRRTSKGSKPHAGKSVSYKAHRYAYELTFGPIPEGFEPDHICTNRSCVNPFHLDITTHRINVLRSDAPSAINARKTECIRGHSTFVPRKDKPNQRYCLTCSRIASRTKYAQKKGG